ncbi:hypothetical protein [uncultured Paracoccus sp.]|uniref:hypothetical protein n=1 Tax=uncultured Paracoccus sp. TaxID=189685 RepID=UPI00260B8486|nr:hypothetical protein [uncultured Paracoccus sp.]
MRARSELSDIEKRALLAEQLTPRLSLETLKRNRNGVNRIFKAARTDGGPAVPEALSYREIERIATTRPEQDDLHVRVTRPKLRLPWTEERLAAFLTSPLFTGCWSAQRRWMPGPVIIRDATYWVPLIMLTLGTRIEEPEFGDVGDDMGDGGFWDA